MLRSADLGAHKGKSVNCKVCSKKLKIICARDFVRKKYCSRSCRQKGRFASGEWSMNRLWEKANTSEANKKKARSGTANWKYKVNRCEVKGRRRPESNAFRKAVFERDGFRCVWCGSQKNLVADHIRPFALYPKLRYTPKNGRTLCNPCHRKTDTYGAKTVKRKRELNASV